jgi:NmrA-like family
VTRSDSTSILPEGVKVARVDYSDDGSSLVAALKGQQFLVITLSVMAPPDTHSKIVQAAAKAGVPYIMPNSFGWDKANSKLCEDIPHGEKQVANSVEIQNAGAAGIVMSCGFWYEWSLALGEITFGFNIKDRKVTFFDDGKTITNISTWAQCGRALAAFLSLPESGASPSVSEWKNKSFYISSYHVSQRDILNSLHRVLGTTDKDWEIIYEPAEKRYKEGIEAMKMGSREGFAKAMYSRVFYPNGDGDFESSKGISNELLGLPKEDMDASTKTAVEMVESGWNPFAQ